MTIRFLDEEPTIRFLDEEPSERSLLERGVNLAASGAQGLTFGTGPKIAAGVGSALSYPFVAAIEAAQGDPVPSLGELYEKSVDLYSEPVVRAREDNPYLSTAAEIGGAVASGAGLAGTKAIQALGNLARRGRLLGRVGAGALAGEATQRVYEAGSAPVGQEGEILARPGLSLGGVLGGAIPALGAGASAVAGKASPAISAGKRRVADLAKKHNIPIGLDDITDSKFYKTLISEGESVPLSGAAAQVERQLKSFTKAVAKTIGLDDVDNLNQANMEKAYKKIGKQFDDLTKGKTFEVNNDVLAGLDDVRLIAERGGYGDKGEKLLDRYLKELYSTVDDTGTVKGENLARVRSTLNKVARDGSDPNARAIASNLESVISDFITEGAPEKLRQAKQQYKNFLVLEPLASKNTIEGVIPPAQLQNRVRQIYKRQYTRGQAGDIGELAEIGQLIKQNVPNSGTAQRTAARALLGQGGIPDNAAILGTGFVNPLIPTAIYAAKGLGMGANRAIQGRNYNPAVIARKLGTGRDLVRVPNNPVGRGVQTGAILGSLQAR